MTTLADLKALDLDGADVSVWVFKTSGPSGAPRFNGHWISITEDLTAELKAAVLANVGSITETIEYGILAQNNEGSALTIMTDETYASLIAEQVENETEARKVTNLKHLSNSKFYVVKFVTATSTLLAVRKTDASWSTRKAAGMIRMIYTDDVLDVDNDPIFTMQPTFDFFVLGDQIFIASKPRFESVLLYKEGHEQAFETLKAEPAFAKLFTDIGPINAFVGANKIHLRRAIAIQQKGHYKDARFITRLRKAHKKMNLLIDFDEHGRIVPTLENCRDIFQALLDHRLDSRLSTLLYDVPNTAQVA